MKIQKIKNQTINQNENGSTTFALAEPNSSEDGCCWSAGGCCWSAGGWSAGGWSAGGCCWSAGLSPSQTGHSGTGGGGGHAGGGGHSLSLINIV